MEMGHCRRSILMSHTKEATLFPIFGGTGSSYSIFKNRCLYFGEAGRGEGRAGGGGGGVE